MLHYIPPEAYGKVGNLSGPHPPPAPSAHIAQQSKQKSSTSKGGIVGAVRGIGIGKSRSAPGQRRSGDKSGSNSGTTTPKEDPTVEASSGPLGAVFGAFGGGSGSKKRGSSLLRAQLRPVLKSSTSPLLNPLQLRVHLRRHHLPVNLKSKNLNLSIR